MDMSIKGVGASYHENVLKFEDSRDKIILEPVTHIIQSPTTKIWRELAKAFNFWLNISEKNFDIIDESYRKFYYSDLLFDDVRNSQTLRNSKSSCQTIFGLPRTLNALFQMNFLGARDLTHLNPSKASTLYLDQMEKTCISKYMEEYWNKTVTCPTEEEYCEMIIKKTYGQLTSQIKFMQLFSTNENNFTKLSSIIGLYLHILEDYRQFESPNGSEGKLYNDDVPLARFNFPIIHAIKSETEEGEKVFDLLLQKSRKREIKIYLVSLLKKLGSFDYTKRTLIKLKDDALEEIKKFGKNTLLENIIHKYFNISAVDTENLIDSIEHAVTSLKISSSLNQMSNVQLEKGLKEKLLKPYNHANSAVRRNYMLTIYTLFRKTLKTPDAEFDIILKFMRLYAYAVFMLDDIQDISVLRKGIPCSYLIYGLINTVNSIFYTFSVSYQQLLELNEPRSINLYYDFLLEMFRGQGMELYWRDNFVCPTEDEYVQMVAGKTGAPLSLLLNLMKLCGPSTIDVNKLPPHMALYFQAHDDYENLISQDYYDVKGFCEDISEGKFGFPTLHAINTHPEEGKIIMNILRQRTYDVEIKKYCLSILEKCGSFEYTRKKLIQFRQKMVDEMEQFNDKNALEDYIKQKYYISFEDHHRKI